MKALSKKQEQIKMTTGQFSVMESEWFPPGEIVRDKGTDEFMYRIPDPGGGQYLGWVIMIEFSLFQ